MTEQLFIPEYDADGYPRLEAKDFQHMRTMRACGVLQIGDDRLRTPARPVEASDDLPHNLLPEAA